MTPKFKTDQVVIDKEDGRWVVVDVLFNTIKGNFVDEYWFSYSVVNSEEEDNVFNEEDLTNGS